MLTKLAMPNAAIAAPVAIDRGCRDAFSANRSHSACNARAQVYPRAFIAKLTVYGQPSARTNTGNAAACQPTVLQHTTNITRPKTMAPSNAGVRLIATVRRPASARFTRAL